MDDFNEKKRGKTIEEDVLEEFDEAEKGVIGKTIKKLFTAGVGAAFLTEESLRNYLGDLKLPKEVMKLLVQSAQKSKEEITLRVSREMSDMLERIDWSREARRFLHQNKIKLSMEIQFEPRDEGKSDSDSEQPKQD